MKFNLFSDMLPSVSSMGMLLASTQAVQGWWWWGPAEEQVEVSEASGLTHSSH